VVVLHIGHAQTSMIWLTAGETHLENILIMCGCWSSYKNIFIYFFESFLEYFNVSVE
jgi:hypothetical protein